MTLTNGEAKKEIAEIILGMGSDDRTVPSPKDAFKLAALYPSIMITSNVILWSVFYVIMMSKGDNTGQSFSFYFKAAELVMGYGGWISIGITVFIGLIFVLINFSTALAYFSIPVDIRNRSKIVVSIKTSIKKVAITLWMLAVVLSIVGLLVDSTYLFIGDLLPVD